MSKYPPLDEGNDTTDKILEEKTAPKAKGFVKTSLAGLPSSIPSRPLKENKAKIVPNYIKKARQAGVNESRN